LVGAAEEDEVLEAVVLAIAVIFDAFRPVGSGVLDPMSRRVFEVEDERIVPVALPLKPVEPDCDEGKTVLPDDWPV
jgi:hypothetical protein